VLSSNLSLNKMDSNKMDSKHGRSKNMFEIQVLYE